MSDDLIRREDAIKAVRSATASYVPFLNGINVTLPIECETALHTVPSAGRPQGEWIFRREFVEDTPFTGYRCSNCNYWQSMGAWNFCPNCGAKMKGADDEKSV